MSGVFFLPRACEHGRMTHPSLEKLIEAGAKAYLVGGAVRDRLLGRATGNFDYVVAGLAPAELERRLRALGEVDLVGREFGVFKFRPEAGVELDIALPRRETYAMTGGARDLEAQSDQDLPIEKDLARRDYTVNAMAVDLASGETVDPFGGKRDLEARLLRVVGDPAERFREDLSRLLRGLRFAAQLGFAFEEKTWDALREAMPRVNGRREDGSFVVPREIVARELLKSLAADPPRAAELWSASGALETLAPELKDGWPDAIRAAQARLEQADVKRLAPGGAPEAVRLGLFFAHLGPERASALAERLKLASAGFGVDAPLVRALASGDLALYKELGAKPLIGGEEAMAILGLPPGPELGRALDRLILAQGQGKVVRREDAIAYLKSLP